MSKGVFIGLCVAVFVCLFAIDYRVYRPSIERDLSTRTRTELAKQSIAIKSARFQGRDGEIRLADQNTNPEQAGRVAGGVFGVRVARITASEVPSIELPHVQIERIGENLRLSGLVSSDTFKLAFEARAATLFRGAHVENLIEVRPNVAAPKYLADVVGLLELLARTAPEGQLELLGNSLRLSGEVPNVASKEALENRARQLLPFGLELTVALRTPHEAVSETREVAKDSQRELESAHLNFEYDSAEITQDSQRQIEPVVEVARDLANFEIRITGHTDAKGSDSYNLKLSEKRARAIAKLFAESGVTAKLHVEGQGKRNPISDNETDKGRAANRRVDFQVMGGG